MTEQLDVIIANLKACFDGKPWYGDSVMKKLDSISWEMVNENNYKSKSIAVLVQHILNWRIFVLKKLEGDLAYNLVIDGENDWTPIHILDEDAWLALKEKLVKSQQSLLDKLKSHNDGILTQKVPGKTYNFGVILTSIAQHDIYHLGQIAMLHSMQKS